MIRLLEAKGGPIPLEQLRVLDMFLMFPPLLHRLSLTIVLRDELRSMKIEQPTKVFVRLPSTASVWQDLQIYQLTALKQLAGLGVLKREDMLNRNASLEHSQVPADLLQHAIAQNEATEPLMRFLVEGLGKLPMVGSDGLVRRAGLPLRGPVT